jgi:hypothetical protein
MDKTVHYRKSQIQRSATDVSDRDIDLKNGERMNKQAEERNPKFRSFMDKVRKAAKSVGRSMKMLLMLALTLGIVKHR